MTTVSGSLINFIMSTAEQPAPWVDMGATLCMYSDRHAYTVIEYDGDIITLRRDKATRTDENGQSESQSYDYTPDPAGSVRTFRRDKSGVWQQVMRSPKTGRWVFSKGTALVLGRRDEYRDYSF